MIREPQRLTAVLSTPHLTAQLRSGPRLRATLGEGIPVAGPPGLPRVIYDEGNPLPVRTIINMVGPGVTAADDAANDQTVITIPGDAVSSVFTRTGAIIALAGDYTAAQVTNAVSILGSYPDPAWITSLHWDKISGEPSAFPPSAHSHDWADITGEPSSFPPSVHVHAAADVTSGVFAVARLGTGTPTSSVYLRGDGQWASVPIPADAVTSVFGRTGVVVAQSGDYAVAQVTGAVPDTRTIIAGSGLSGGGALSGNVTLSADIAGIQTPWLQDINGAGYKLSNTGAIRATGFVESAVNTGLTGNLAYDGVNWRYIANGSGFVLQARNDNTSTLYTAPAGTAGAVAAVTPRVSFLDNGQSSFSGQVNLPSAMVGATGTAYRPFSVTGTGLAYTAASSGGGTCSIGTGPGQTDAGILFGFDETGGGISRPYGWIQAIKAGTAPRALLLNAVSSSDANVVIGCPEGTFLALPPNTLTFFLNQATNKLYIRVAYSTGVVHDAILTLP